MSELGKVCEHGSLARSCCMCELESRIAFAERVVETAKNLVDSGYHVVQRPDFERALKAYDAAPSEESK